MTQFIRAQSVTGGVQQFDGAPGTGLFSFPLDNLPKEDRVLCRQLGIFGAGATATWIAAYFVPPAGQIGDRILVGSASTALAVGFDGNLAVTFCPGEVPRAANGQFWSLNIYSSGISDDTTATLAYDTCGGCA